VKHWTGYEGTGSKGQTIGERGKVRIEEFGLEGRFAQYGSVRAGGSRLQS